MDYYPISWKRQFKQVCSPKLIALVFFLIQPSVFAQGSISDVRGSTSLFGQLYGIEVLGISVNHNINNRFSINGGFGVGPTFHLGGNFYFNRKPEKKTSFFVGAQAGYIREAFLFGGFGDSQLAVYIPIGFEYIAAKGFTIQIDLGPNFTKEDWGQANTLPFYGSLKIGYTFRKKSR